MNEAFRSYAFGRSFNINLSEGMVQQLALLCSGDQIASLGLAGRDTQSLLRRGLVEMVVSDNAQPRYRATKAGVLVFDLMVEAGEYAALEETRRKTLDAEAELHRLEWQERFGDIQIRLRDRHLRHPPIAERAT